MRGFNNQQPFQPFQPFRFTARWISRDGRRFGTTARHYSIAETMAVRAVAGGATDATITTEVYRDGKWVDDQVDEVLPEPRAPS